MGTYGLAEVAAAAEDPATLWFQLYVLLERDFTRRLVQASVSTCTAAEAHSTLSMCTVASAFASYIKIMLQH